MPVGQHPATVVSSAVAPSAAPSSRPPPAPSAPPKVVCTCAAGEELYDKIEGLGKERNERQQSGAYHFYNFQNWVKSVLIQEYTTRPCPRVLDLACGKLGDLLKWKQAGVTHYVGVDISLGQLREARVPSCACRHDCTAACSSAPCR